MWIELDVHLPQEILEGTGKKENPVPLWCNLALAKSIRINGNEMIISGLFSFVALVTDKQQMAAVKQYLNTHDITANTLSVGTDPSVAL